MIPNALLSAKWLRCSSVLMGKKDKEMTADRILLNQTMLSPEKVFKPLDFFTFCSILNKISDTLFGGLDGQTQTSASFIKWKVNDTQLSCTHLYLQSIGQYLFKGLLAMSLPKASQLNDNVTATFSVVSIFCFPLHIRVLHARWNILICLSVVPYSFHFQSIIGILLCEMFKAWRNCFITLLCFIIKADNFPFIIIFQKLCYLLFTAKYSFMLVCHKRKSAKQHSRLWFKFIKMWKKLLRYKQFCKAPFCVTN